MAVKKTTSATTTNDLIKERAHLLSEIRKFEKDDMPSDAWLCDPSPDVIYLANLKKLSDLCSRMIEQYKQDHE